MSDSAAVNALTEDELAARGKAITDLALGLVCAAEAHDASPTVFFNALSMAFLTSYIATRTDQGFDVTEEDLGRAINLFIQTMVAQSRHIMQMNPELVTEKSRIILPGG